ncbi:hypothetical protein AWB74_08497 [Caballeronia arvi]|uniref:Uncharacterized protein n=1 Tax=Caballeronia arvi TaxID=1777135 RepID=A0A158L4U0_9BURK|nr:hypothetical protein AWB74_08497 [Caballeronia arvi]
MDDTEASRFTERLGLPVGWLDTPRAEAEIPESVSRLLTPAARGRASVQPDEPAVLATQSSVPRKRAAAKPRPGALLLGGQGDTQSSSVSANVPSEEETIGVAMQDHANDSPGEMGGHSLDESEQHVPLASPTAIERLSASALTQRKTVSLPSPSVTSVDNLYGIEPIAEALIKTLAGKARTGRLDELKALELLQQAILL